MITISIRRRKSISTILSHFYSIWPNIKRVNIKTFRVLVMMNTNQQESLIIWAMLMLVITILSSIEMESGMSSMTHESIKQIHLKQRMTVMDIKGIITMDNNRIHLRMHICYSIRGRVVLINTMINSHTSINTWWIAFINRV